MVLVMMGTQRSTNYTHSIFLKSVLTISGRGKSLRFCDVFRLSVPSPELLEDEREPTVE